MNEISNTAEAPQPIARVVKVVDTSIPGILPGFQVFFDNNYVLSIIQPNFSMGSKMMEIACWIDGEYDWIRNPHWGDDVYRVFDVDELNAEAAQLIPGYQPISLPANIAIGE